MTAINEIRSKILPILNKLESKKVNINQVLSDIRQVLPEGVNIAISKGNTSEENMFEFIIHDNGDTQNPLDKTSKTARQNVLFVLQLVNQKNFDFEKHIKRCEHFRKIKIQVKNVSRSRKVKSRDPNNLTVEESQFPYVLFYILDILDHGSVSGVKEMIVRELHEFTTKHGIQDFPNEIILKSEGLWFLSPLLFKARLTGFEIGWSMLELPDRFKPCYICRRKIYRKHFFYDQLCQSCGDLNYLKRVQKTDLSGRIALVSGARVKIGYQVGLRLLRSGAQLIALTRFPHDAALRYSREPDFIQWKDRLHIYGLDFRDISGVVIFIKYLINNYPHLDIIVNNAAQTVRHPPIYYKHLMENERKSVHQLPKPTWPLLKWKEQFQRESGQLLIENKENELMNAMVGDFQRSAELSQISFNKDDVNTYSEIFPKGQYDNYGEQMDLRDFNTWVMRINDVSIPEILEVQLINQVVPTMFISKLKGLLKQSPHKMKYIVNVSSPEGQFQFEKEGRHPHTCMAKAALNMLTFSIADDYAQDKIFVTSTDPGWVTEQFPLRGKSKKNRKFAIDLEDAAARVCDPISMGENDNKYWRGCFFRHYKKAQW